MIPPEELNRLQNTLEVEKLRLEGNLRGVAARDPQSPANWNASFPQMGEAQNASSSTMEENADEVEEYETRLEETEILERHLADVVRALDKMQKGTYGLCEACGKEIPVGRLHANPAARFDIEHEG